MTRHPAAGRTKRSREIFEQIAIGNSSGHNPRALSGLVDAGLIVGYTQIVGRDAFGPIKVTRYQVPTHIHMQWCAWCAEQPEDENV